MAGYTFAKTIDDASSDIEQPHNPYDLARGEGGPSLGDQRQRFVMSGLWVVGPDLDDPEDGPERRSLTHSRRSCMVWSLFPFSRRAAVFAITRSFHLRCQGDFPAHRLIACSAQAFVLSR